MSRLESMRRRLTAQIDGIEWAAQAIAGLPGDALEIGLGNGRSYDHLRQVMPDRRVWVIDRQMKAHPSCVPPAQDFLQGEAEAQLQYLLDSNATIAMAHYDLGIGVAEADEALCALIAPYLAQLIQPGGAIMAGQPLPGLARVAGPCLADPDRYYFYQM